GGTINSNVTDVAGNAGNANVKTKTEEQAPGLPTPVTVPSVKPLDQRAAAPVKPAHSPDAAVDPMTRYWAATALFQEVQLLNRYVRDAWVRRGSRPYVVRVQATLMPAARNEPYDAYCTCSFFTAPDGASAQMVALRAVEPERLTPASRRGTPQII